PNLRRNVERIARPPGQRAAAAIAAPGIAIEGKPPRSRLWPATRAIRDPPPRPVLLFAWGQGSPRIAAGQAVRLLAHRLNSFFRLPVTCALHLAGYRRAVRVSSGSKPVLQTMSARCPLYPEADLTQAPSCQVSKGPQPDPSGNCPPVLSRGR